MTMRIVFLKEYEDNKRGQEKFIDRMEAVKLCEKGVAVPFNLYEKIQRKEAEKKAMADLRAKEAKAKDDAEKKAEKEKADAEKQAELLKKKESVTMFEKADSKKTNKRSKAVKK